MIKAVIKNTLEALIHFLLALLGIICLGALPEMFRGLRIDVGNYLEALINLIIKLVHPLSLTYGPSGATRSLFPQILIMYKNTAIIFICSFIVSLIISFIIVFFMLQCESRVKEKIKSVFLFIESIPDILVILSLQIFVVWVFKITGTLVVNIAAVADKPIFLLPIISLSIPTTIMFIKLLLLKFEGELEKDYVLFAKAKGLNKFHILKIHVLRNVVLSVLYFSKTNIWFMLSNLYIIEWIYNAIGIFIFTKIHFTNEIFTVSLILIYIPIFIAFKLFHYIIPNPMKERL
ncbi:MULTISPECIES: ABC transporter permease subunit [Bacillus cereus group]|uniref:ABC transporter permease subunit n=1 Tax=Bacillus cereus group TaxID=86661 RepID=UPI000BED9719|nr:MULTISPECIES: ABC transporter permease subunit [Bacillus cereus group]PDY95417.1 peptide ABC transporter permease [Bacillus anthracis]MDW3037878.1 ABC transporter permease subunit [Bacillus pacificus]MED1612846.1 ABC transporter permease subunit [Bacillus paranthracis]MED1683651.1 ABC transporter permease subunit [Bacillus paranthracis]PES20260.1 peptide ABC transporter permease [Bacillus anthracis]